MDFYTTIAKYYDHIFPFKPPQKEFVKSFLKEGKGGSILDIGCGTGSLLISLQNHFDQLVGIDPDTEMLAMARRKYSKGNRDTLAPSPLLRGDSPDEIRTGGYVKAAHDDTNEFGPEKKIAFHPFGMLDIAGEFEEDSFDMILCFGNTLVHLGSEEEVEEFLQQAAFVLKPGGQLLMQLINYDRILDQGLKSLPTIESDEIRFERIYDYAKGNIRINFNTRLTVKTSGLIIENSVPLLALRPGRLREVVQKAGFSLEGEFGNFKKEVFGESSQPYILRAQGSGHRKAQVGWCFDGVNWYLG